MTPKAEPAENPAPLCHDFYYHMEDGAPVLDNPTDS